MIKIQSIASSSRGNCYRLISGNSQLLIECGIPLAKIKKAINYELGKIDGCLISHEHGDHAMSYRQLAEAGVTVYMTKGTALALRAGLAGVSILFPGEARRIGGFGVLPIATQHDAAEPVGYLIVDGDEKVLFATDTYFLPYKFHGLTQIMIECNYDLNVLQANISAGVVSEKQARRLLHSHMSIENTITFLRMQNLSQVKHIWLLHGSAANGSADFAERVMAATGRPVTLCEP